MHDLANPEGGSHPTTAVDRPDVQTLDRVSESRGRAAPEEAQRRHVKPQRIDFFGLITHHLMEHFARRR